MRLNTIFFNFISFGFLFLVFLCFLSSRFKIRENVWDEKLLNKSCLALKNSLANIF